MRFNGKIYWGWSKHKGLHAGARCLIHNQMAQLHPTVEGDQMAQLGPTVEEVQPCLHQAQKKGQGPEILWHWPDIGRASEAFVVQFSPCQILVQRSLSPHPASLISTASCAAAHRPVPGAHPSVGPRDCQACMAATERMP